MKLSLRYSARSERGFSRSNNEDAVYAGPRLLALADGMGGHAAGEVAAYLTIAALAPLDQRDAADPAEELRKACLRANQEIAAQVDADANVHGMGTTLTALYFSSGRLALAHIGDSRAYMLRAGELVQLTRDETFVQELLDDNKITPEEARMHPQRSMVLRALTGGERVPTVTERDIVANDRYVLCSDGVSDVLSDAQIQEGLEIPDPQKSNEALVHLALRAGSQDNVSCVVADITDARTGYDIPLVGGAAGNGTVLATNPR
jgi:PPM family protein phosphatase